MKKNNLFFLFLIILLVSPILFGLFNSGLFISDDGSWMVIRFSSFYEELHNGQFPVRFLSRLNNGYGYPVANFLYPLFMYMGVPVHVLGFSFVATIKIILGLSMIGSTVFVYLWLSKFFDRFSSIIGSLFYTYAPYHLYDLYKRGSVGEIIAFMIAPFILWQIERKSLYWSSLGIAALILSHNTLAILFIGLIMSCMLLDIFISSNRIKIAFHYISVLALGLGVASFFWIPAVYDLKYTIFSNTKIANWSSYFADINLIGFSVFFVIFLTLIFIFNKKISIRKHKLTIMLLVVGVFSIFLSSFLSVYVWNLLPVSFIQFPFRFLSVAILCISFLAACSVSVLSEKKKIITGIMIVVLGIFFSWQFVFPKEFQNYPDSFYSTNQDSTTVKNEYMPKWVKNLPGEMPKEKVEVLFGDAIINSVNVKGSNISFGTNGIRSSMIKVNVIYFPGWVANIDGVDTKISFNDQGVIYIRVPEGQHEVRLSFKETGVRLAGDLISMVTILGMVLWWLLNKKIIINKSTR